MKTKRIIYVPVLLALLTGCSATTTLSVPQPDATLVVKKSESSNIPRTEAFSTTTFGNYEFRADAPPHEPFYGLLPLKFNGGYLALDILFFAPAMFFNLREVYRFYEIDVEQRVVRYKRKADDDWSTYVPLQREEDRARKMVGLAY